MGTFQFLEKAVEKNPDKPFIIHETGIYPCQCRILTYKSFYEKVLRVASALTHLDIGYKDRVAVVLGNCPETLICWLAANVVGATAAIVKPAHVQTWVGLDKQLKEIQPKLIIDPVNVETFLRGHPWGFHINFHNNKNDDIANIIYSSGTTGEPKGVMITHRAYTMCGEGFPYWLGLQGNDVLYTCLSLAHINAQAYSFMGAIHLGATMIIGSKFNGGENFWKKISANNATIINMLGNMLQDLWKKDSYREENFHCVGRIATGEAIANADLHKQLEERFGAQVIVTYGSSESPFGGFAMPLNSKKKGNNFIGLPKLHPQMPRNLFLASIVREDRSMIQGQEGEVGELVVSNPSTSPGYWNNPRLTAEKFKMCFPTLKKYSHHYHTGDLIKFDDDGYAIYIGRKDDVGRVGGNLIAPREVESVLNAHPQVLESAVIFPSNSLGEKIIEAHVVLKEKVSPEELESFCKDHLAVYQIPKKWVFRDSLPKTENGKLQRKSLY